MLETTMVYVTHDQVEAMTLADRIVVLKDGLIMQVGTPRELYEKPDNIFVAQFIGSPKMNLMPCSTNEGYTSVPNKPASAVQLGIRPEHIGITDVGAGQCDGIVQVSEYLGADFFHYIDCGPLGLLTVRSSGAMPDIEGKTVGLTFETDNLHFFGADDTAL
jgi:multiple sugar transport system ATP-binding protein